jgi:signal transduction histidine kinase
LILNLLDVHRQKINIQEMERRRLAQDLHDDLGGTLSAIKGIMSNVTTNIEIISLIEKAILDLRIFSRNLMPPELANEGLAKAIYQTILRLQRSSKVEFTFISFGDEVRLSEEKELNIYRIVSELLNNIVKHSKANRAVVQLVFHEKYLHVTVEDNGVGINTNVSSEGMGLKNVNSRAKFIAAQIHTDYTIHGTTFFVEIPYD